MRRRGPFLSCCVLVACGGDALRGARPRIELDADALDFGPVQELRRKEKTLGVRNAGGATLLVETRVEGSEEFSVVASPARVTPGAADVVKVAFVPAGTGYDSATLVLTTNEADHPTVEVPLAGGPIYPEATVGPDPLSFAPATRAVETRAVTVRSTGLSRLTVSAVALAAGSNPDFALTAPELPAVLETGAPLEVQVAYTRSGRTGGGVLEVTSDDPAAPHRVRIIADPLPYECTPSDPPRACYTGAADTRGKGRCKDGEQACEVDTWGACTGETLPAPEEVCGNGADDDCDAATDESPCRSGCAFPPSTALDAHEPNDSRPAAVHETTAAGTNRFSYDLTLTPGDHDWFRFDVTTSGSNTTARAAIACAGWGGAGCGASPKVGLELWYTDDLGSNQLDGSHNGQSGLAFVQNSGPINAIFAVQRWLVHAFPSSTVCAGEAANATLEVTVTNN